MARRVGAAAMSADLALERDLEYERDWHEGDDAYFAECLDEDNCGWEFVTHTLVEPTCPNCGHLAEVV